MILQVDSTFVYHGITVTDWMQGIGSLIAIIAGLWAFITLFRKDSDKQNQINSLIRLAEQSQLQTTELALQSKHMEESNQLTREQLQMYHEARKFEVEQNEANRKVRKNNILPFFNYKNSNGNHLKITHDIQNDGEEAMLLDINCSDNITLAGVKPLLNNIYPKGSMYAIVIKPIALYNHEGLDNFEYWYKLIFRDKDANKYFQQFNGKHIDAKAQHPVEVTD